MTICRHCNEFIVPSDQSSIGDWVHTNEFYHCYWPDDQIGKLATIVAPPSALELLAKEAE